MNSYENLNKYRIRRRNSIRSLAKEIGINNQLLRRTLRGETRPRDYNAAAIDRWMDEHADEIRAAVENS
jgi:hypothetical protein